MNEIVFSNYDGEQDLPCIRALIDLELSERVVLF